MSPMRWMRAAMPRERSMSARSEEVPSVPKRHVDAGLLEVAHPRDAGAELRFGGICRQMRVGTVVAIPNANGPEHWRRAVGL
jgi:hypothetical protein